MKLADVFISPHALGRWCEYANVGQGPPLDQAKEAFWLAKEVRKGELLPMPRLAHTRYFHHAATDLYFVVEMANDQRNHGIVVTIKQANWAPAKRTARTMARINRQHGAAS